MAQARRRSTLYAAFTSGGEPVHNVFDFDRSKLETLMADRVANEQAFPGEHLVQITVELYRKKLVEFGFPVPGGLTRQGAASEPDPGTFRVTLSREDVGHLMSAIDVTIGDIEERVAAGESAELGSSLLEVNRALRGRLAALLSPEN